MKRLSSKNYWTDLYNPRKTKGINADRNKWFSRMRYNNYLLWELIFKKYLPAKKEAKALEIGSAPGHFLVKMNRELGYTPFGIEYTLNGAEMNQKIFRECNLNPDNIIHGDFFSDHFQKEYKGYFDIVISRGFIEHFTDVPSVVEKHINLLTAGGYLVINIPNLNGINKLLASFLNKEGFLTHNVEIMNKRIFASLFAKENLKSLYCDYYGFFDFHLFNTKKQILLKILLFLCQVLQVPLDIMLLVLMKNRTFRNQHLSPYLLFIGQKTY